MRKKEKDRVENSTAFTGKVIIPWGFQFKNKRYCMSGEIRIYNASKILEESYLNSLKYIDENGAYNPSEIYTGIHQNCIRTIQASAESLSEEELKTNCTNMLALSTKILEKSIQGLSDVFVVDGIRQIGEELTIENITIYNCDVMTQKEEQ